MPITTLILLCSYFGCRHGFHNRELKQRKFSGRRRLEWQREAGTDVAVASRQIQLFKRQVHSDGDGVAFQRKK